MYMADELMEYWPYLPKSERAAKMIHRESIDSFLISLKASPQFGPALAWKADAGSLHGTWRTAG